MGYRELLKVYMAQIRSVLGSDYVEVLANRSSVSKRELGELRTIAAELNRERFTAPSSEETSSKSD